MSFLGTTSKCEMMSQMCDGAKRYKLLEKVYIGIMLTMFTITAIYEQVTKLDKEKISCEIGKMRDDPDLARKAHQKYLKDGTDRKHPIRISAEEQAWTGSYKERGYTGWTKYEIIVDNVNGSPA